MDPDPGIPLNPDPIRTHIKITLYRLIDDKNYILCKQIFVHSLFHDKVSQGNPWYPTCLKLALERSWNNLFKRGNKIKFELLVCRL
jgi:hypothetical protein